MKILVDKLPQNPRECLFAIHNTISDVSPVCKFMLSHASDWDGGITFSYSGGNSCKLCSDECCPFLRKHMYD